MVNPDSQRKLRDERNELPLSLLNEYEVREFQWRKDKYQEAKQTSVIAPLYCSRHDKLLSGWAERDSVADPQSPKRIRDQLINHAKHCPQCVEFPQPLPWDAL